MNTKERINKVIDDAIKCGLGLTVDNIVLHSLTSPGGTLHNCDDEIKHELYLRGETIESIGIDLTEFKADRSDESIDAINKAFTSDKDNSLSISKNGLTIKFNIVDGNFCFNGKVLKTIYSPEYSYSFRGNSIITSYADNPFRFFYSYVAGLDIRERQTNVIGGDAFWIVAHKHTHKGEIDRIKTLLESNGFAETKIESIICLWWNYNKCDKDNLKLAHLFSECKSIELYGKLKKLI